MNATERRNTWLCVVGEALWGFQSALIMPMTMLTLVLRHYEAGPRTLGALTAIENGLLVLPQLIGLLWFRGSGSRRRAIVYWHLLTAIPAIAAYGFIILGLDGRTSPTTIRWLILASFATFTGTIGVIYNVWMDWLARLFHQGIRGSVMGVAYFAASAAATVGGLVASRVIHRLPGIDTFAWIFLTAAVIAAVSMCLFLFVVEPPASTTDPHPSLRDLRRRFQASLADRHFGRFLVGRILASAGFCITPFVAVHFQSTAGGGLGNGTVVLCGTAATLAAALSNMALGRLGDRRGHRLGILVGAVSQVLTLLLLLLGAGLPACLLAYFGVGVCAGVSVVSHNNMLFETCPHDHRLAHITAGNLVLAAPMLIAPLLAGALAERQGLPVLFATSLAISLAAAVWVLFAVRDPRDADLVEARD